VSYKLFYTTRAKSDLRAATDYIAQQVPETAEHWFNSFVAALVKLQQNPLIYGVAPESDQLDENIRQLIYRTKSRRPNRALFVIRGDTVYILCIRRPGQRLLTYQEIRDLLPNLE